MEEVADVMEVVVRMEQEQQAEVPQRVLVSVVVLVVVSVLGWAVMGGLRRSRTAGQGEGVCASAAVFLL